MSEVNVQKSAGCNEIKINVKPVPVNPVVLENSYRGIDYNVLKHKPQIEGNELIGNKTAKELLGFDKTDMDATVSVAQGAEEVAHAANEKAQNAVDISNAAKETADGIDAKATKALTNSNTAVNTANSAKQTAEGIYGMAAQALTNSTDAKNIADSYQGQITTLRNDVDDLGDQVSQIEAKIPETATAENQLVTKEQMDDAIAGAGGGGDVDLTGYYNRENLLGADEIEIVPEPVEGGIDNHTLACWHFDENLNPTTLNGDVSKFNIASNSTVQTSQFKFPTGALYLNGSGKFFRSIISNIDFFSKDFTIDFWFRVTSDPGNTIFGISNGTSHDVSSFPFYLHYGAVGYYGDIKLKVNNTLLNGSILSTSTWYHIATVFKYIDKSISVFVDGKKYGDTITLDSLPSNANNISFYTPSKVGEYIDELRISDIARYTEDFEPPTKPYSVAEPTGNYVVRNKTKLVHKSDIGIANGVASLDANAKVPSAQIPTATTSTLGGVKPDGNTITVTEDGTISATGGSGTGTTGLPLLFAQWSDHLLEDFCWLRADTFSWQDGTVYTAAYQELLGEYNLVDKFYPFSFTGASTGPIQYFCKDLIPAVGDAVYELGNDGVYIPATSNDVALLVTSVEMDTNYFGHETALIGITGYGKFIQGDYGSTGKIEDTAPRFSAGILETENGVSFVRTPKGYKICAADQEANVLAAYNNTGVAWYYILDVPNQRFKLPRTKFGFTGLRTGAGNYVAPGLPNITGDFNAGGVWTRYASGAFKVPTAEVGGDGPSGNGSSQTRYTFDASRSSSVYGASQTVQPPATEMYLYFYVGNYTQTAIEQTAGISAETLNNKADLDGMNAPALMKVPQFWQGADFAKMRAAIMDLDWANAIRTWSSTADSYRTEVMPADGLLAGVLSCNGQIEINGNKYSTATTNANWGASYVPFFVKKGDVVKARCNSSFTVLVPFKNQGNADYNPLGFFQYQGQFADSDSLPTPKINGWALVGNNQLYYVGTNDAGTLIWLAGNTITDLGVTGADYVVESYSDDSGNWWRKYKSGWVEQGGTYSGTFNTTSVHNLLLPFADTNYSILGEALDAHDYTVSWCARKTSFTTASFTGEGFRGTTGNNTYNTLRWEAKGQGA